MVRWVKIFPKILKMKRKQKKNRDSEKDIDTSEAGGSLEPDTKQEEKKKKSTKKKLLSYASKKLAFPHSWCVLVWKQQKD